MKRASVTEAKNRLSALLDRVRHGESVIIEDRGIPVAQLNPVGGHRGSSDGDRLRRLERQGILRPAAPGAPRPRAPEAPATGSQPVTLSELVRRERREGW